MAALIAKARTATTDHLLEVAMILEKHITMTNTSFDTSTPHEDNFRVHFWMDGRDKGCISAPIRSWEQAEAWINEWIHKGDDLRIHDRRSVGHIRDSEAANAIYLMGSWSEHFDKTTPNTFDEGASAAYEILHDLVVKENSQHDLRGAEGRS